MTMMVRIMAAMVDVDNDDGAMRVGYVDGY